MSYYSQSGSAVYNTHYYHGTDFFGGNQINFASGDSRTKYITASIAFTESVLDRTFTFLLDPSDTDYPNRTYDADAGSPSFVTVTILGVSPQYVLLKSTISRVSRQLKVAKKIQNPTTRAKKVRKLTKKKVLLQARLNRTV
jgi:hypothetical protein